MLALSQPAGEVNGPVTPNKAAAVEPLRRFSDVSFLKAGYSATTTSV